MSQPLSLAPPSLAEPLLDSHDDSCHDDSSRSSLDDSATPPQEQKSKNVPLILAYTLLMFGGRSMWSQSVLSAFVYLLRDEDPECVGTLTAIMGVSQLVASFPAGALADRYRRDSVLRVASLVGSLAISVTFVASWAESYPLLGVALGVWGLFWGIAYTCLSALFADSIHDGDRSYWFTYRMILVKTGNMVGPTVALALFALLGDEWTARDCSVVMMLGQGLCFPAICLLCFLSDDDAVTVSHACLHQRTERTTASNAPLACSGGANQCANESLTDESTASRRGDENHEEFCSIRCFRLSRKRIVPTLVASADIIAGIAAGMSIRYFPIFFLSNLRLNPVIVQVLFMLSSLCQMVLGKLAQVGGKKLGRCQMTVMLKWMGIAIFMAMIASYKLNFPVVITCTLWLLRMGFMNSTGALTKSIVMDHVPREERGKWSALESVNMFSWSGSAFIGGILVKNEGIIFNFCVTAGLQLMATLPLIPLFDKVEKETALRGSHGDGEIPMVGSEEDVSIRKSTIEDGRQRE